RTGDLATLLDALSGRETALATVGDLYTTTAALVIGTDLSQQHPLLAYQLRANYRHHSAHVYTVSEGPVRERKYATMSGIFEPSRQLAELEGVREKLQSESELVILFGDTVEVRMFAAGRLGIRSALPSSTFALSITRTPAALSIWGCSPTSGLASIRLPSRPEYERYAQRIQSRCAVDRRANPLEHSNFASRNAFLVVQDLFLTETAQRADVVFLCLRLRERGNGHNVTGEVQRLKRAIKKWVRSRPEIFSLLLKEMGVTTLPAAKPDIVFEEIRKTVRGYNVPLPIIATGGATQTVPVKRPSASGIETGADTVSAGHLVHLWVAGAGIRKL
ncbi:MAG: NADH-quinone oxidoreductase, partial [Bryobacteraceae bacterium]